PVVWAFVTGEGQSGRYWLITAIRAPESTASPGDTRISVTAPARPARTTFSIFIASRTQMPSLACTRSPTATSVATIVPGIGARIWPEASPAAGAGARRARGAGRAAGAGSRRAPASIASLTPSLTPESWAPAPWAVAPGAVAPGVLASGV